MDEHPYAAVLRAAYLEWNATGAADPHVWLRLCDEHVVVKTLLIGPGGQQIVVDRGPRAALRAYFEQLCRESELLSCDVYHIVAEGETVIVAGANTWRNRGTGRICNVQKTDVWTFENDVVVRIVEQYRHEPACNAFGGVAAVVG